MGSLKIILSAYYWHGWKGCGRLIIEGFRGEDAFHTVSHYYNNSDQKGMMLLLLQKKKIKWQQQT